MKAMDFVTLLGLVAGALTTISFLPQVIKTYKTRSTKDISLEMYVLFTTGLCFWIVYGLYINSLPIILANAVVFVLAFIILALKLKHG